VRIGVDIRCLTGGRRTGVEEYAIQILENIFRIDQENQYLLFFNSLKKKKIRLDWEEKYPNVKIKKFRIPNKLLNLSIWYFNWPKIDRLLGGTDVVFLPNINFVSISQNSRLVAVAHDLSFERYPETFSQKARFWHFLINPKKIFKRAEAVISVSDSTKNDLMTLYNIDPKKITTIHSGIAENFKEIDRNDETFLKVKEKYRLPFKFILYLGTIEPRKNLESLIEAFEKIQEGNNEDLQRYKLVLAGYAGWGSRGFFQSVSGSVCKEKIISAGKIKDKYKPYLYNLASLFVYPSLFEGFGFPVLEAMKCGTPVITSNCASLPEIAGKAALLIDPEKPDDLVKTIREVLLNRELRDRMKKEGIERAKVFSWEKVAKKTLEIIVNNNPSTL
jgi:glycosyltransferase involved in cell wall biosynthesis